MGSSLRTGYRSVLEEKDQKMAAGLLKFRFSFLLLVDLILRVSGGQNFSAELGQNVTLPCRAPQNKTVLVVQWSRTDLGSDYVFLYRDKRIDQELQDPSFKNRVDLQDKQMTNGDVSLVLKNVTIDDGGTYECRVVQRGTNQGMNLVGTIILNVHPPGDQGGDKDWNSRHLGLIALLVFAVVLVAVVLVTVIYRMKKKQNPSCHPPKAGEPQDMRPDDVLVETSQQPEAPDALSLKFRSKRGYSNEALNQDRLAGPQSS